MISFIINKKTRKIQQQRREHHLARLFKPRSNTPRHLGLSIGSSILNPLFYFRSKTSTYMTTNLDTITSLAPPSTIHVQAYTYALPNFQDKFHKRVSAALLPDSSLESSSSKKIKRKKKANLPLPTYEDYSRPSYTSDETKEIKSRPKKRESFQVSIPINLGSSHKSHALHPDRQDKGFSPTLELCPWINVFMIGSQYN
ncbi:hypothetical protein RIR_jg18424.t1 [Rhizophagus irregularis DAOM 181602=DAOM 197198]|nr:hypothetical protein RIR_jg18424.t1 [Rhizophagus irregularis DAOM 181602=DAOM 197198]